MKLCDYRYPRNAKGKCGLQTCDVSRTQWRYDSLHVFAKDGFLPNRHDSFWGSYECTEEMTAICPYRTHTPKPKPEKCIWYQCPHCGGKHRTELAKFICKGYKEWYQALDESMATMNLVAWTPEGTREEIYAKDVLAFEGFENVRAHLWPRMQATIVNRDKHTCQDCGAKEGTQDQHGNSLSFEVHHIIPRGLGGSDHPRNLKFLCKPCHKKYNDKFNGYIKKVKRAKAQDLEKFCENDGGVL